MNHPTAEIKENPPPARAGRVAKLKNRMTQNRCLYGPPSDRCDGTRFFLAEATRDKRPGDRLRFLSGTRFAPWPKRVDDPPAPPPLARVEGVGLRVATIGNATHLVQTVSLNLLVDPVW